MSHSSLTLLATAALCLTACSDATAPQAEKPHTPSADAPAGAAQAQLGSPSGAVGGVWTPYPSVACQGLTVSNRAVWVSGATVSPATGILSSSQDVYGDVFLYRYASTGWILVNTLRTKSAPLSGSIQIPGVTDRVAMPNAYFRSDSNGQPLPAGYYSVLTRFTWMNDAMANGFYHQTGTRWVSYSDADDYQRSTAFGRILTGTGWCYIY
jgi:hypothetical protein